MAKMQVTHRRGLIPIQIEVEGSHGRMEIMSDGSTEVRGLGIDDLPKEYYTTMDTVDLVKAVKMYLERKEKERE